MSETFFPINDLLRRRLHTALVVASLALSMGSALFLVLFTDSIGFTIWAVTENKLTSGLSTVLSSFLVFVGILTLITLAAIVSFSTFMMMSQRMKEIGLMKAAGCPNHLIFGYFFNELVLVNLISCPIGIGVGLSAYCGSLYLFSGLGFQVLLQPVNIWLVILVIVVYLALTTIFGVKPVLNTTRIEPARALSSAYSLGLGNETGFEGFSSSHTALRMALRSLFRRKSANIRMITCCTIVFTLLTIALAGGIIANQTSASWVEKAAGRGTIMIGHPDVCDRYKQLLSRFYETRESSNFDHTNEKYFICEDIVNRLSLLVGVELVDARLIIEEHIIEVLGYVVDPETHAAVPVGDNREGESLIVGIDSEHVLSEWTFDGRLLGLDTPDCAVIGDSIAQKMFTSPLVEHVRLLNKTFDIVGVCLDTVNNGKVTYVPFESLKRLIGGDGPNIVMLKVETSHDRSEILNRIKACVNDSEAGFVVVELEDIVTKSLGFLGYLWSTMALLPLLTLGAATLCLTSHVILTLDEQRQDFAIIRSVGARPSAITKIIMYQNLLVLLSSYATGISLGIILTLLVLVQKPIVTSYTVLEITALLLIAVTVVFALSLFPAFRFRKRPILDIMT